MQSANSVSRVRLILALALAVVAISSAALFIRTSTAPATTIAFWRVTYATLFLAPFAIVRRDAGSMPRMRDVAPIGGSGVLLALHFAAWIASLAPSSPYATSVAASAVLVTLHPVLVALATPMVDGVRVPSRAWSGMLVALAGGVFIAAADARHGTHRFIGDMLAFAGAVAAAGYFLIGRRLRARIGLLAYVTPVYAIAACALALIAYATHTSLGVRSAREHVLFIALALGPMILGHTVLNWALRHLPAWVVSTVVLAEPIGSTLLVFVARGERPAASAVCGGVVVLVGVALTTLPARGRTG